MADIERQVLDVLNHNPNDTFLTFGYVALKVAPFDPSNGQYAEGFMDKLYNERIMTVAGRVKYAAGGKIFDEVIFKCDREKLKEYMSQMLAKKNTELEEVGPELGEPDPRRRK